MNAAYLLASLSDATVLLTVAGISAATAIGGPLLLSRLNAKQARADKAADRKIAAEEKEEERVRQAEVALKVDAVADNLVATAADQKVTAEDTTARLVQIHTLTNSTLTLAKEEALAGNERNLVSLLEIVDLKKAAGLEPSPEALAVIEATRETIARLKAEILESKEKAKASEALLADTAPETAAEQATG